MSYEDSVKSEDAEKRSWIRDIVIPLGSVLIGIVGLAGQTSLPAWTLVVATLYLVAAAAMAAYRPALQFVAARRTQARVSDLARSQFPMLLQTVRELQRLMEPGNGNTLIYILGLALSYDARAEKSLPPDPGHIGALRSWALAIEGRARSKPAGEFLQLSKELSLLIDHYSRFLSERLPKLQAFVDASGLDWGRLREIRQGWNDHRDAHNLVVRRWEDIARRVNDAAGRRVCVDSYASVGTVD